MVFTDEYREFFPTTDALTLQDVTVSSAVIGRTTRTINAAAHIPCEQYPFVASAQNTLSIAHEGNDTQFEREYYATVPVKVKPVKVNVNLGIGHNISAYTSGSPNLTSVDIDVHRFVGNTEVKLHQQQYATGFTALAATGIQIFVINDSFSITTPDPWGPGDYFSYLVRVNVATGTATRQEGVMPLFPYQVANTSKFLSQSGIELVGVRL